MRIATALVLVASLAAAQSDAKKAKELEKQEQLFKKLELEIKRLDALQKNALGAAQLERTRARRDAVQEAIRKLKQQEQKQRKIETPNIKKLLVLAKKGDVPARNALLKLRAQIDQAIQPKVPVHQPVFFGNGMIVQGRAGIVQLGGFAPQPPGRAQPPRKKAKKRPEPKPIPPEEKKRLAEIDLKDQEARAQALEKSIIELTRRALELERRLAKLQAETSAAESSAAEKSAETAATEKR